MKHILVAYNGTEEAEKAFDLGLDFAHKYQAEITVLSVASLPSPPEDEETEAILENAQEKYKELFEKFRRKNESFSPVKIKFEVKAGHPAEQIIFYAEQNDVDHIIMGHRTNTFFHRWLLGSIAKQVMIDAPCAITIAY